MSLRLIFNLIAVSGIFKKNDELDILPPPPPFPEIEEESKKAEEAKILREIEQKQKGEKLKLKEKKEGQRKEDRERKVAESKKERGKKVFEFFHGLGLVKTEKEKKEFARQKFEYKKQKELAKKKIWQEKRKKEIEKQKEIERQQREAEKIKQKELELKRREEETRIKEEEQKVELEKKKPEKKPFPKLFGRKEVDLELEKELKEIEEIASKPKKVKEEKLDVPEFKFPELETGKPKEIAKAEEEIQSAISGMKVKERPSIVKRLFKKKEKAEEQIELPGVMPRTYDKIDYVVLIEEKIHKARSFLMDFKFDEAKNIYIEVMEMYNELEPKKKAKVYQDIKDLYYERKSAEKFMK